MAAAKSNTNWFVIGVSAAVVVVLAVLALVVVNLNNQATAPGPTPEGAIINQDSGAITIGNGEDTVDTYIDFMCPICNQFEQQYGEQLQTAANNDKITLNIHPIAILDFRSTTDYSSRSAAAMYCVAENDPDVALDYMAALFENQPAEGSAGLDDAQLKEYAKQVGADGSVDCISDKTYLKFPVAQAKAHEIKGTPTIEVNGKRLDLQAGDISQMEKLLG
ncbi:DsbA family protein [Microbacterium foliorum]|uniref:DsbA family protein n=1 Tax=Microbacterium foliorum TaxID=104336 RepID=UPI001D2D9AEF|nr:thioredoxin domain-containing protein [Microbacterium foliorum]CAH0147858.1 Serine/threonine-protein kinase PknE [Microbacterium foliorum]CAH0149293.1 Serine/threonine-protein kinase PknE [Microbacterium foliorum]